MWAFLNEQTTLIDDRLHVFQAKSSSYVPGVDYGTKIIKNISLKLKIKKFLKLETV